MGLTEHWANGEQGDGQQGLGAARAERENPSELGTQEPKDEVSRLMETLGQAFPQGHIVPAVNSQTVLVGLKERPPSPCSGLWPPGHRLTLALSALLGVARQAAAGGGLCGALGVLGTVQGLADRQL